MKYMISFSLTSNTFKERVRRFLATGGGPPKGVTMHGRWHSIDGAKGFLLASSDDPKLMLQWVGEWADLIEFQTLPVLDDEEAAAVMKKLKV